MVGQEGVHDVQRNVHPRLNILLVAILVLQGEEEEPVSLVDGRRRLDHEVLVEERIVVVVNRLRVLLAVVVRRPLVVNGPAAL